MPDSRLDNTSSTGVLSACTTPAALPFSLAPGLVSAMASVRFLFRKELGQQGRPFLRAAGGASLLNVLEEQASAGGDDEAQQQEHACRRQRSRSRIYSTLRTLLFQMLSLRHTRVHVKATAGAEAGRRHPITASDLCIRSSRSDAQLVQRGKGMTAGAEAREITGQETTRKGGGRGDAYVPSHCRGCLSTRCEAADEASLQQRFTF